MNKSNTVVIYDLRLLAYRNLYKALYDKNSNGESFMSGDNPKDTDIFCNRMVRSIWGDIDSFGITPSNIIFARDSKSWRLDKHEADVDYKAGRRKKKEFDIGQFFKAIDKFCDDMESMVSISTVRIDKLEADDIMYYLSKIYNKVLKKNVVIVSGDKDIYQLVNGHGDYKTVVYNSSSNKKCVILPHNFRGDNKQDTLEDDIFAMVSPNTNDDMSWIDSIDTIVINKHKLLLNKILCGDSSDNIPAVNAGNKSFTNNMFNKLFGNKTFEDYDDQYFKDLYTDSDSRDKLAYQIMPAMKISNTSLVQYLNRSIHINTELIFMDAVVYNGNGLSGQFDKLKFSLSDIEKRSSVLFGTKIGGFINRSSFSGTIYDPTQYYDNERS